MLLVESALHGLIARSVISLQDAVDWVDTAAEVNHEIMIDAGLPTANETGILLDKIRTSLLIDLRED